MTRTSGGKAQGSNGSKEVEDEEEYKIEIVWRNIIGMAYLHWGAFVGLYFWFSGQVYWQTIAFGLVYGYVAAFGVTCGTHRLWAHKAYKANLPLRVMLAIMQTCACQNSIHEWCRDHRVHHKFSETDGDPHNARRGFFFAHMGWLLCKKHPHVRTKGKIVDMSDLEADPVIMFQKKWFVPLTTIACFVIPTLIPWYYWGEPGYSAWCITLTRYVATLHATWLVNSAAHLFGNKPYDENINPAENLMVSIITPGEGYHNYHHVFPWDYKAAELGDYKHNFSTAFIDFFAWIGWAHDLKTVPERVVQARVARTGDGSYCSPNSHKSTPTPNGKKSKVDKNSNDVSGGGAGTWDSASSWGWDDIDTPQGDKQVTLIHYKRT